MSSGFVELCLNNVNSHQLQICRRPGIPDGPVFLLDLSSCTVAVEQLFSVRGNNIFPS